MTGEKFSRTPAEIGAPEFGISDAAIPLIPAPAESGPIVGVVSDC